MQKFQHFLSPFSLVFSLSLPNLKKSSEWKLEIFLSWFQNGALYEIWMSNEQVMLRLVTSVTKEGKMTFLPFLSLSPQLKFEFKWGAYGNLTHSSNEYPSGRILGIGKAFDWIYHSFVPCVTKVNTCHTCNHSLSSFSLSPPYNSNFGQCQRYLMSLRCHNGLLHEFWALESVLRCFKA